MASNSTRTDVEARCKPGDLWQLGQHRLLCDDATDRNRIQRFLADIEADAILTDPPYCSGGWQEASKKDGSIGTSSPKRAMIINDQLSTRGYTALIKKAVMLPEAKMIHVFTDWRMWCYLFDLAESSGFSVRSMLVWDKQYPGMGIGWRTQHELILVGTKGKNHFDLKVGHGNVISCPRTGNVWHPTEKPLQLLETILKVATKACVIYDPFAGSGSTLLAAHQQNRQCYAVELSPYYCDVTMARYESLTGDKATLIERIDPSISS